MKFFIFNFFLGLTALLYGLDADAQLDYRRAVEADKVHSIFMNGRQVKGQGIVIAVIDTGVASFHPDMKGKFVASNVHHSFHHNTHIVIDRDGHGTHVATSIVADRYGIAPEAKILNIRLADNPTPAPTVLVPNPQPTFNLDSLANAIRYAVDAGSNIINLSLGGEFPTTALQAPIVEKLYQAMAYADSKGVLILAAAGNGIPKDPNNLHLGNKGIDISFRAYMPASINGGWFINSTNRRKPINNLIVVCAVNADNSLAEFSNFSLDKVHVCAPGVGIEAANYLHSESTIGKTYAKTVLKDGTSMATPIVAGVAALVWSADKKNLNAAKVKDYILRASKQSAPMHPGLHGISQTGSVINAFNIMSLYLLENAPFLGGQ
jgi:subtilisin family serine protease